jgi:type II secretory pathway component PulF
VEAGLPLETGLRALSEEAPSRRMRRLLRKMSDELARGTPPDEVLSRPRRGLPNYLRGLIKAGVQSGQLGAFLEQFLSSLRRRREAALSFWAMMAYPLLLVPFAFLIGMALLGWIVPQFREIFEDFGVEVPQITLAVVALSSRPVVIGLFVGVPAVLLAAVLLIAVGRFIPGHATRLRLFQRIPLIGTQSRMRGLAEFCSLLGLLVSGRIPLPDALRMTGSAVHDANLQQGARRLAARVEQGESLEAAALGLPHISRELKSLFRWERRGAAFGDILLRSGEVYASRSRVQAGLIIMALQPMIFVAVAMFIGIVVLALFMPLVKLLNELT